MSWSSKLSKLGVLALILMNASFSAALNMKKISSSWQGRIHQLHLHPVGESGFIKKLQIIDKALPKTDINLAYFIFEDDYTSAKIAQKLVQAEERGVNVRVLVDFVLSEKYQNWLGYMVNHGIEIKRYNPGSDNFRSFLKKDLQMNDPEAFISALSLQDTDKILSELKTSPILMQKMKSVSVLINTLKNKVPRENFHVVIESILDAISLESFFIASDFRFYITKFTHRLHHKIMMAKTAQGLEFINGGRNLSDEYHLSAGHELLKGRSYPFYDAESSGLILEGQSEFIEQFEQLWSSQHTKKVAQIDSKTELEIQNALDAKIKILDQYMEGINQTAAKGDIELSPNTFVNYVENRPLEEAHQYDIVDAWEQIIGSAQKQVTIVSAYLFLKERLFQTSLMSAIEDAAERGVRVDLYTNSYDSTDMNLVNAVSYSQFAKWKESLGENVHFHELNKGQGEGSLHAKIINVDNRIIGVGSANSDPRSAIYDSNNLLIMSMNRQTRKTVEFFQMYVNAHITEDSGLGLTWNVLTLEKAQELFEKVKSESETLLKVLKIPTFDSQL